TVSSGKLANRSNPLPWSSRNWFNVIARITDLIVARGHRKSDVVMANRRVLARRKNLRSRGVEFVSGASTGSSLHYFTDHHAGIRRVPDGKRFIYRDPRGRRMR